MKKINQNILYLTKEHFLIFLVIAATLIAYINILGNNLVWDDLDFLTEWKTINSLSNVSHLLLGDLPVGHEGVYRPVRSLIYLLSKNIWQESIGLYRLQSIFLHLTITLTVYFIAYKITKNKYAAFISSLIFGVHPIHTEAITYLTTSYDVFGVLFALLSLLLFSYKNNKWSYRASIFFAFLAFLTYEIVLLLPIILIMYDFLIERKSLVYTKKYIFHTYLPYFLGVLLYIFARLITVGFASRGVLLLNSYYVTLITIAKAFWYYVTKLVIPFNLNVTPTLWGDVTNLDIRPDAVASQKITDLTTILGILALLTLIVVGAKAYKKEPIVSFSLFGFLLALLPVFNSLATGTIFAEKYLYFASFFLCLLVGYLLSKLKILGVIVAVLIASVFLILTFNRNYDWKSELTLWRKTVSQSPRSAAAYLNLGFAYYNLNEISFALQYWEKAIEIFPKFAEAYINIGEAYSKIGDLDTAEKAYKKAIETNPTLPSGFFGLANLYASKNDLATSEKTFRQALIYHPNDPWFYYNLGVVLLGQNKTQESVEMLKEGVKFDPDDITPSKSLLEKLTDQK